MKSVTVSEAQANIEAILRSAQKERIVLTRGGKPSAVILGVDGYDEEDLRLAGSAEFWQMIEERRKGRSIPLSELRARIQAKTTSNAPVKVSSPRRKRATKSGRPKR